MSPAPILSIALFVVVVAVGHECLKKYDNMIESVIATLESQRATLRDHADHLRLIDALPTGAPMETRKSRLQDEVATLRLEVDALRIEVARLLAMRTPPTAREVAEAILGGPLDTGRAPRCHPILLDVASGEPKPVGYALDGIAEIARNGAPPDEKLNMIGSEEDDSA